MSFPLPALGVGTDTTPRGPFKAAFPAKPSSFSRHSQRLFPPEAAAPPLPPRPRPSRSGPAPRGRLRRDEPSAGASSRRRCHFCGSRSAEQPAAEPGATQSRPGAGGPGGMFHGIAGPPGVGGETGGRNGGTGVGGAPGVPQPRLTLFPPLCSPREQAGAVRGEYSAPRLNRRARGSNRCL